MSSISIRQISITKIKADCIVNAANNQLRAGGGVCGAIFAAAGRSELTAACEAIGGCNTGDAVITPGFKLPAEYIIHTVGPIWRGGGYGEPKDLYDCYRNSLLRAMENDCHSIAFPLISSGIYGYPQEAAWKEAVLSCSDFLEMYDDYDIDVIFCVIDDFGYAMGNRVMASMLEGGEEISDAIGTPRLEQALKEWHASDDDDPDPLLDLLFEALQNEMKIIVPVKQDDDCEEDEVYFQILETEEGMNLLACFTNDEEMSKNEEAETAQVMPMIELMVVLSGIDECDGIVINPFGDGLLVPNEVVEAMINALVEMGIVEINEEEE